MNDEYQGYCLSCVHCVYKDSGEFFCFLKGKPITLNYKPTVYFNCEGCKDWVDQHRRSEEDVPSWLR